ncbi:MAG: type II secretion system GspH family protein [Phycisphaerae bacterium]|nr:type II secretion system GspH family protein [Phycisphaerae bacterium]
MKKNQKAFTLIELLVVISIIALLVAILMPALGKAKDQARELICKTNLKTYGTVAHMYLAEQDNQFPSAWNSLRKNGGGPYSTAPLDGPLWEYLGVQGINVCPVFESVAKMKGFKTAPSFTYSMNILIGWDPSSNRYMKNATKIE